MNGRRAITSVGPYSKPESFAKIDGRTREGRFLSNIRTELTEHLGGAPTATERALIERAVWLSFRVAQLDAKMASNNSFTDHDSRTYLGWSNALARCLRQLGLKQPTTPTQSLAEYIASRKAATKVA